MKKKIFSLFTLLLSILILTACGKGNKNVNADMQQDNSTQAESAVASKDKLPNETEILKDINDSNIVKYTFNNVAYTLKANSISITKGSLNDVNGTIYCTLDQTDTNYTCTTDFILYYKYYEMGGWKLDNSELQKRTLKPNNVTPKELADAFMKTTTYQNVEFSFKSDTVDTDGTCFYIYNAKNVYPYMDEQYAISLKCSFGINGWNISIDNSNMTQDWSKTYGTWTAKASKGEDRTLTITIKDINLVAMTCTYDYKLEGTLEYSFGSSNSQKSISGTVTGVILKDNFVHYLKSVDCEYCIENNNSTLNFNFYLGRNKGVYAFNDNMSTDYFPTKN